MQPQSAQTPQSGGSITDRCAQCWATMPYVSKKMIQLAILSFILSFFLLGLFANVPAYTIFKFQIWRIFTSPLVSNGIITGLFAILWICQSCRQLESEHGSMYILHAVGTVSILGNMFFVVICGGLSFLPSVGYFFAKSIMAGLWPLLFGLLAIRCSLSQDPTTQLCCLPIQVPTKWYPLILGCLFQLFGVSVSLFCGIGVGYLYAYPNAYLAPSSEKLREYEQGRFSCISSDPSFVSVDNAQALPVWNPLTMQGERKENEGSGSGGGMLGGIRNVFRSDEESEGSNRQAFSGRGYTLGTGQTTNDGGGLSIFGGPGTESKNQNDSKSSSSAAGGRNKNLDSRRNVLAERLEARLRQQKAKHPEDAVYVEPAVEMQTIDLSLGNAEESKQRPATGATVPTLEPPPSLGVPEEHAEQFAAQYDVDLQSLVAKGYRKDEALSSLVANGGDYEMATKQLESARQSS